MADLLQVAAEVVGHHRSPDTQRKLALSALAANLLHIAARLCRDDHPGRIRRLGRAACIHSSVACMHAMLLPSSVTRGRLQMTLALLDGSVR